MNVEGWLEAIRNAQLEGDKPDGISTYEMTQIWQCTSSTATTRIKELIRLGVLKYNGKRRDTGIYGQITMVPVYSHVSDSLTESKP